MLLNADISDVPAELIKHLLTLVLAFAGVWLANKGANKGSKDQPVNIAQPLDVRKHDDAAKKSEVVKVEASLKGFGERVDSLAEQMNAQFAAMTQAGQNRAAAITQSFDDDLRIIAAKIESFMLLTSRHDAVIPQLDERISHLAEAHNEAVNRIHSRIDDAIRLNSSTRK